jgi:hypothetical protein
LKFLSVAYFQTGHRILSEKKWAACTMGSQKPFPLTSLLPSADRPGKQNQEDVEQGPPHAVPQKDNGRDTNKSHNNQNVLGYVHQLVTHRLPFKF